MWDWNRVKDIASWELVDGLWTPGDVVELDHVLVIHDSTSHVPDADSVVYAKTWRCGRRKNVAGVWGPLADRWVSAFDGADLLVILLQIIDIHLSSQVSKAGNEDESSIWREKNGVAWAEWEGVGCHSALVKDRSLGWHESVDNSELLGIWRPCDVVDWTLLVECDAGIETAVGAQDVQVGLSVIRLAGLVDFRLGEDDEGGAESVPLELDFVALEEGLLGDWGGEVWDVEDLDGCWHALEVKLGDVLNLAGMSSNLTFFSGTKIASELF